MKLCNSMTFQICFQRVHKNIGKTFTKMLTAGFGCEALDKFLFCTFCTFSSTFQFIFLQLVCVFIIRKEKPRLQRLTQSQNGFHLEMHHFAKQAKLKVGRKEATCFICRVIQMSHPLSRNTAFRTF